MNAPIPASSLSLLDAAGVDPDNARTILGEALAGADDGELFLERSESEALRLRRRTPQERLLRQRGEGFGLRVVAGETAGYAHAAEISEAAIRRAADLGQPGQARPRRRQRRRSPRHQRKALWRGQSGQRARLLRQGRPAAGDRRLRPRP
ncbi:PmbA/TldA family metallopeptidase [Caulobacter segnis]